MKNAIAISQRKLTTFAFVCLVLATSALASSQTSAVVVPFDFSRGAIGIEVVVKGRPLYMLLDTGVDPSVIDLDEAKALHLPIDRSDAGEAGGFGEGKGAAIFPSKISGLTIQNHSFRDVEALASDMRGISTSYGRHLDGILGKSFLSGKIVLIDYPENMLGIYSHRQDAAAMTRTCRQHWTTHLVIVDGFPVISAFHFGDAVAPVSLDTGANGGIGLFRSALKEHGISDHLVESGSITHAGARGEAKSSSYIFNQTVGFGPFLLPPGQKMSLHSENDSKDTRVANVGNQLFAAMRLKILLNYRASTMTFYGGCSSTATQHETIDARPSPQ